MRGPAIDILNTKNVSYNSTTPSLLLMNCIIIAVGASSLLHCSYAALLSLILYLYMYVHGCIMYKRFFLRGVGLTV